MFFLHEPTTGQIRNLLLLQRDRRFTYPSAGTARGAGASFRAPRGYIVDHNRVRLGIGLDTFDTAAAALRRWSMFDLGWVRVCWSDTPIIPGAVVGVLAYLPGLWSLNMCRIVYIVDDHGPTRRVGFGYGTLPEHVAHGEERFLVEWNRADDTVWYDILAYSRPKHPLVRAGYPLMRLMQRRFARDSKRAMLHAATTGR